MSVDLLEAAPRLPLPVRLVHAVHFMASTEDNLWPERVGIIGVGLLGGSVPLAMRRVRPQTQFVGLARSPEKRDRLNRLGIVDEIASSVEETCLGCDAVVIASPVDLIAELVIEAARCTPNECLITDVGSTKAGIVNAMAGSETAAAKFVAAHPIAGSEKSGPDHAVASLFDKKVIVLTPHESASPQLRQKAADFWRLTGGMIHEMGPDEHDTHLAAVSHVPHLVSALVAMLAHPDARSLVGSGWNDITRVAAGDPTMWTAICQENRDAIAHELGRFSEELDRLRAMIRQCDDVALKAWLAEAQRVKQQTP